MSATSAEGPNAQEHLVILIHGIRTQGSWAEMVAAVLESTGSARVLPLRYGYFDFFRFLSPLFTRGGPVKKILRELRDIRAENPNAKISVIAHSFGTYAVMKALEEREIILYRLILCGSIIPENFRRANFRSQLGRDPVLNDCGTRDIWPPLARSVTWGYGATGTFGLGTNGVRDRFNRTGHSGYFNREFVTRYWAPYIHEGRIEPTEWEQGRNPPPWWQSMLAWFPFKYLLLAGIVFTFWLAFQAFNNSGKVKAALGDDIMVGHYTGNPAFTQELRFHNATRKEVVIDSIRLTLQDPSGLEHPMMMEGIFFFNALQPPLTMMTVKAGEKTAYNYSFFNYSDAFNSLHQEVSQYLIRTNTTIGAPDQSKDLLSLELAEKAVALAKSEFIWKPGKWRVSLTARAGDQSVQTIRTFSLTPEEVDGMWRITEHYRSGIGVFQIWRLVSFGNYKPFLPKTADPQ